MTVTKRAQVLQRAVYMSFQPASDWYHLSDVWTAKVVHLHLHFTYDAMHAGDRGVPGGPTHDNVSAEHAQRGDGINLTAANHVLLMEPAFNPGLEDQAIGRAHRMGQISPVTVKKLYIKV